jgi:putative endonuclease
MNLFRRGFWARLQKPDIPVPCPNEFVQAGISGETTKNCLMFYAYVLKSIHHDFYYKGHCQNLEKRIAQHNAGLTKSIRPYIPFQLVYAEQFTTREEAISREKFFKTAAGRKFLKNKLPS